MGSSRQPTQPRSTGTSPRATAPPALVAATTTTGGIAMSDDKELQRALPAEDLPADISPLEDLREEAEKAKRLPDKYGILAAKSGNSWVEECITMAAPMLFYFGLIVQFEITALFGPTGSGKTIFAMQIAEEIARFFKILYIDLELSAKQFQMRFTDPETGLIHVFPENFLRAEIDPELITREDLEVEILDSIEEAAKQGITFFVLDNITFACNDSEKGATAGTFMMRLIRLKKKYNLTIICIAHTPKIKGYEPLGPNHMAGSAKLMNFFDEGIAIGKSAKDVNLRYVKQVKNRSIPTTYDDENVIVYEVTKESGILRYEFKGHSKEDDHLKHGNPAEDLDEIYAILRLQKQGMSQREIAKTLEISLGKVQRRLEKAREKNITLPDDDAAADSNVSPVSNTIQPSQTDTPPVQQKLPLNPGEDE